MKFKINKADKSLKGEIHLTCSKSISNRLLIIKALSENKFNINNISDSEDTKLLTKALASTDKTINIGHAGTAMRFSTAYFATREGEWIITGSDRMRNRPIGKLVDALNQLGASISYLEKNGFPPIKTSGKKLQGNKIEIDGSISSQFITALLLICPNLPNGIELILKNKVISSSYIRLTLGLMQYMGIEHKWENNIITILPQKYIGKDITVEADWSGASYWYQMAALCDNVDLTIHGLQENSYQGDAAIVQMFEKVGINTEYKNNSITLSKTNVKCDYFKFDFLDNPDMVQTLAVTLVMMKIPFTFTGTQSLRVKETDRVTALQNELGKYGATLIYTDNGILSWDGKLSEEENNISIKTYDDHRMAMAFAPIAITKKEVSIEDPDVIIKSYPNFWKDMQKVGFEISEA